MILLTPSRLTLFGALLFLPGVYFTLRFFSGFVRMLYRKLRKNRPYLKGSASDYLWFALGSLAVTLAGALLLAGSAIQSGLQAFEGTRVIGTVRAESPSEGRIHLTLDLGQTHPSPGKLEAELAGARWALEGEYLQWRGAPRWLGFQNGHRVTAVLGSARESGAPDRPEDNRALVAGTYAPWYLIHRHPAWAPMAQTSLRRSPWLSADGSTYELVVTGAGYVLVSGGEQTEQKGPKSPDEVPSGSH
jgi:hypothetical protein